MTTLPSQKNPYAFKLDQRTSSLVKVSEPHANTSVIQPTNLSQKSFLSFQSSFRMNSSLPHSSKKFRGTSSQRPGEFLQEITNSLPKISSTGATSSQLSSQLAAVINKKTQTNTKYTDYDFEQSHTNKKPAHSGFVSQSQRSILSHPNKSVPDILKLGSESSPNNHIITNRSPVSSIISMSSPKKTIIIEEKLPLKRRALNSDIKEAYRAVINSKEHGAFHDLPQKSFEKDPAASPQPRNKNKKISYIDHAKELEKREREKEEERLADEIKTRGVGDFHRKIALYNFIRGNYLVEPDNEIDFKPSAASHRKIVVPVKVQKEQKKDFLASLGQSLSMQQSHYMNMNSRAHSRDSFEKSEMMNSRRVDEREYRKYGEDNDGGSSKRAEAKEDTVKMKESTMETDLKKMQELGNFLSTRKPQSENEHLVFKLVKDGNEQDLGYLLAKFPELVKAEDNTKQTPLHWAVKRGYYNVAVCLCKYGADIHAADITDRTPFDMAERLKQTEILDYLKIVNKKRELENRF